MRGGGIHAHVVAARCGLETGRSLNIALPGWRRTFDPPRDAFNHEHGGSRPDAVSAWTGDGLEVPRQGKDYITARDADTGKRWPPRGALHEHDFEPERVDLAAAPADGGRPEAD